LEKLLDDQLEKSNDGSFSVEKQSAKYNLCRAVAIIADIKLMEQNNDMRLRAFICYGMNVQSLHCWMQVLRQNEMLANKFFEPWSYIQTEHSMQELTRALQPLGEHTFRLALDYEVASMHIGMPKVHGNPQDGQVRSERLSRAALEYDEHSVNPQPTICTSIAAGSLPWTTDGDTGDRTDEAPSMMLTVRPRVSLTNLTVDIFKSISAITVHTSISTVLQIQP
jgi:hypothetical protein